MLQETASVVQWSEFLATNPEVPGWVSGHTSFSCDVVGLERGQRRLLRRTEDILEWKCSDSGLEQPRLTAVGIYFIVENKLEFVALTTQHPLSPKVGANFADKLRSLVRYS
jgi:hypothetical protein